jgi:signal peptidase I
VPTRHTLRKRPVRRWIGGTLVAVLIGLVSVAAFAVLSGRYQVRPVLSGSMRPGLPVGGIVITKRVPVSSLQVRDVVVLHRPDEPKELVVHRIISLTPGPSGLVVQTQGDANDVPDPWKVTLRGGTAYRVVYSVPLIGYAAVWVHNPNGRRTLMAIALLMILGAAGAVLVARRGRAPSGDKSGEHRPDLPDALDADPDAHPVADLDPVSVGEAGSALTSTPRTRRRRPHPHRVGQVAPDQPMRSRISDSRRADAPIS